MENIWDDIDTVVTANTEDAREPNNVNFEPPIDFLPRLGFSEVKTRSAGKALNSFVQKQQGKYTNNPDFRVQRFAQKQNRGFFYDTSEEGLKEISRTLRFLGFQPDPFHGKTLVKETLRKFVGERNVDEVWETMGKNKALDPSLFPRDSFRHSYVDESRAEESAQALLSVIPEEFIVEDLSKYADIISGNIPSIHWSKLPNYDKTRRSPNKRRFPGTTSLSNAFEELASYQQTQAAEVLKQLLNDEKEDYILSPFIKDQIHVDEERGHVRIRDAFIQGNLKDLYQILYEQGGITDRKARKLGLEGVPEKIHVQMEPKFKGHISKTRAFDKLDPVQQTKATGVLKRLLQGQVEGVELSPEIKEKIIFDEKTGRIYIEEGFVSEQIDELYQIVYDAGGIGHQKARKLGLEGVPEKPEVIRTSKHPDYVSRAKVFSQLTSNQAKDAGNTLEKLLDGKVDDVELSPFIRNQILIDDSGKILFHKDFASVHEKDLYQLIYNAGGIGHQKARKLGLEGVPEKPEVIRTSKHEGYLTKAKALNLLNQNERKTAGEILTAILNSEIELSTEIDFEENIIQDEDTGRLLFKEEFMSENMWDIYQLIYEQGGIGDTKARKLDLKGVPERAVQERTPSYEDRGLYTLGRLLKDSGFNGTLRERQLLEELIIEAKGEKALERSGRKIFGSQESFNEVVTDFASQAYDNGWISYDLATSTGARVKEKIQAPKKAHPSERGMEPSTHYLKPMFGSNCTPAKQELTRILSEEGVEYPELSRYHEERGARLYLKRERFLQVRKTLVKNLYESGEISAKKARILGLEVDDPYLGEPAPKKVKRIPAVRRAQPKVKPDLDQILKEAEQTKEPPVEKRFLSAEEYREEYLPDSDVADFQGFVEDEFRLSSLSRRFIKKGNAVGEFNILNSKYLMRAFLDHQRREEKYASSSSGWD